MNDNPFVCEHANENPAFCPCPSDCYCRTRTCAGRLSRLAKTTEEALDRYVRRSEASPEVAEFRARRAPGPALAPPEEPPVRYYDFEEESDGEEASDRARQASAGLREVRVRYPGGEPEESETGEVPPVQRPASPGPAELPGASASSLTLQLEQLAVALAEAEEESGLALSRFELNSVRPPTMSELTRFCFALYQGLIRQELLRADVNRR